jgi:glutaredoxin 2
MEAFVQMPLETYDVLKSNNEYLKESLKYEREQHSEDFAQAKKEINDLVEKIEQYKQLILKFNCKYLNVDEYSLEQYLDIDSWTYGMNYKDELLNIGFTKQEMDEFIANKYEQYLKEKEGNTDD